MTTQDLLASIKSRALVPISQATFSDQDLINFANDVIQTRIMPFLIKLQEGYCMSADEMKYITPQIQEIPEPLYPILAQAVACQLLESLGFIDKCEAAKRTLAEMEENVIPLLSPRPDRPQKRVINRNPLVRYS